MIKSRLTSKAQTTIPQAVRAALSLQDGDELQYDLDGDRVILRKARRASAEDPFAAFDEWDSDADRKAYAGL
ncbi:AbrB/MazE/SpoVT family DNA-binding domain-containing protein [Brevundimonas sp. SGAir0440]|uniref:AbrB/MazE/SpoVT family DNA-binding domain-containing protein n=1 Tax=Brevundimonas sp. SGAir0440 TaxID=2579977 RepID=UPI0010CCD3F8|nr:AbrB/MazE/SpoVT family DNA-binding domain-containing protein [Brevundimonas sp. SGAir0440]QCQ99814.1 AbrB/MazE/SpoVT family DNA-binding domain-containing protein [Brevundimonas sp. SGAir0440]